MSEREDVLQEFGNEVVVHDLDGEPSGYAWRVNTDAMADEIVRLRALTPAPRVVVLDEWRVVNKDGVLVCTFRSEGTADAFRAKRDNDKEMWPHNAPHRVVRVALVSEDATTEAPTDGA
jgi:hypothetical protein